MAKPDHESKRLKYAVIASPKSLSPKAVVGERGNPTCNASRPDAAGGGLKDLSVSRVDPSFLSGQCFALDCFVAALLAMTELFFLLLWIKGHF
jgi:hypothetical protein